MSAQPSAFASLLASLTKKEKDKKETQDAYTKALKKGEEAGDVDFIARLKRAKLNYDKNASQENKTRLLDTTREDVRKKSDESASNLQSILSILAKTRTGQTEDTATEEPKKRKEAASDSSTTKPPPAKKIKVDKSGTGAASKSKKEKSQMPKPKEAVKRKKDTKKTHTESDESDDEADVLITKKVLDKIKRAATDLSAHFAAALNRDVVTRDMSADVGKQQTVDEEEDRVLHHENTLRRQLQQPLLKMRDPSVNVERSRVHVPEIDGMTQGQYFIAHQLGELFVEVKELRSDLDVVKRSLNSICLAQVQEHQDMRFIRQAVGGQKLDSDARDVLKRCGQLMELRTNPHLKDVPFTSTTAIRDFFLSPDCITALATYVLTYADFNNHFTGHLVQICIHPDYKQRVWWCDSSIE